MAAIHKEPIKHLRSRIRDFEDRKISGADLSREIFHVARELPAEEEPALRRSLEVLGNKVAVLVEQGLVMQIYPKILEVVDEIESELVDYGY